MGRCNFRRTQWSLAWDTTGVTDCCPLVGYSSHPMLIPYNRHARAIFVAHNYLILVREGRIISIILSILIALA